MANIDTTLFFSNATALFGYYDDDKRAKATVVYEYPDTWELACPLNVSPNPLHVIGAPRTAEFAAENYDMLADAPVLAAPDGNLRSSSQKARSHGDYLSTANFSEGSATYQVALATNGTWTTEEMDSLTFYLGEIINAETDFFGNTPYSHYTFEIVAPTFLHMPSLAQGALEHANSSDYLLMNMSWPMFKRAFLPIFSHEFFHLWNVKRIHSKLLGPFDYTKRVKTTSLWLAEGVTEYYAHTLLARYGIISPTQLYSDIADWRKEMEMAPDAAKKKSLEQLSIDESAFDMDEATLFYSRGPLVALMLDIEIRSKTNNQKSLDDVMRALNADAQQGKTYNEDSLIDLVEQYSGVDLTEFYNRYIHGTDSLPIDAYLAKGGIASGNTADNVTLGYAGGNFIVSSIDSSSALGRAGIQAGDALIAVNGRKLTLDNIDQLSALKDSASSATFSIERNGTPMTIPVNFAEHVSASSGSPASPPLARSIRHGIVGH